jgi:SAM-dependent methyltransferase
MLMEKRKEKQSPKGRPETQKAAYSQAVDSGRYARVTGIHGKYDNVRIYWEDEGTRLFLRTCVDRMVSRRIEELKRIRILDLGCGSGDGYEMIMSLVKKSPGVDEDEVRIILPDNLSHYKGIDLNLDLLKQARVRWRDNPKLSFHEGDFSKGLPLSPDEPPFDIYSTSYGTLSHLHEDQTIRLFADIARHADDGALIVGDWLGRYAYEWQELWDADTGKEQWMDYVISYIYPQKHRRRSRKKLASLDLRLLCREEVERIVHKAEEQSGVKLEIKKIFDRSLMVGRHIDTGDYNRFARPVRRAVNSLHEDNRRTHLEDLLVDYEPREGFEFLNQFFEQLVSCWNALVRYTIELCRCFDEEKEEVIGGPEIKPFYPEPLKFGMRDMLRVVNGAGWFRMGDPRANVIEPQLGYALRGLELLMQKGMGTGHGLVGVFEVKKP